jgi:hypothetical protein
VWNEERHRKRAALVPELGSGSPRASDAKSAAVPPSVR